MAHRNRWFTVLKRWFSMAMLNNQMVIKKAHFSLYPRSGVSLVFIIGLIIIPLFTKFFDCMAWHYQMIHSCATIWRTFRFSCIARYFASSTIIYINVSSATRVFGTPCINCRICGSLIDVGHPINLPFEDGKHTTELWRFCLLFWGC